MKENAVWSRRFARDIGCALGLNTKDFLDAQIEALLAELSETFRFLPLDQVRAAENYARYLRINMTNGQEETRDIDGTIRTLRESCDFAQFLRDRHGSERPVDESEAWSDEDRRDFSLAAWKGPMGRKRKGRTRMFQPQ